MQITGTRFSAGIWPTTDAMAEPLLVRTEAWVSIDSAALGSQVVVSVSEMFFVSGIFDTVLSFVHLVPVFAVPEEPGEPFGVAV